MIRAPVTLGTGSKCGTCDDDCAEGPTIGYEPENHRGFQRDERESGEYVYSDNCQTSMSHAGPGTRERACGIFSIGFRNQTC